VIFFILCSFCGGKQVLSGFHNPYEASFWGRGVKFMLTDMGEGITDTTTFDSEGNIIRVQVFQKDQLRREFDKHHNVIRQMEKGEFFTYFVMSYDTIENYLIKEMQQVSNIEWDDNVNDLEARKIYLLVSRRDKSGRVVEEIDTHLNNTITYYSYKDDKVTEKKEVYIPGKGRSYEDRVKRWTFFYTEDLLSRIEFYYGNNLNSTQYFDNDGMLKFTIHKAKPGYTDDTLHHTYIYY
jgi:hypothetical protein